MDRITAAQRSKVMRAIRGTDTAPERAVRSLVHGLGLRFRLHRRDLPGSPDLVLPRHRAAVFVHGCFWHAHSCRFGRSRPATNAAFWRDKLARNQARDRRVIRALRRRGWRVLVIWECQLRDRESVRRRIARFFASG
jgi:DNA mismatch endonuclease (patch repair protein)